jgi:hypothetical protein
MAQAERIIKANRELMSRVRRPKSTSPLRLAHSELIAALAGNIPHPIYEGATADDLDDRAEHLETVLGAVHAYLGVIISDTAQNWPAPGSEDTKFGVKMGPEVGHAEAEVYAGVQD